MPGQRRVDRYADDLAPQRKAGRTPAIKEIARQHKRRNSICLKPRWFLPQDVLPDSGESWDVLVVDDVGVQRRLRHQVRPGQ